MKYKIYFIRSARFMKRSLSKLVDNLAEELCSKCQNCKSFIKKTKGWDKNNTIYFKLQQELFKNI